MVVAAGNARPSNMLIQAIVNAVVLVARPSALLCIIAIMMLLNLQAMIIVRNAIQNTSIATSIMINVPDAIALSMSAGSKLFTTTIIVATK